MKTFAVTIVDAEMFRRVVYMTAESEEILEASFRQLLDTADCQLISVVRVLQEVEY